MENTKSSKLKVGVVGLGKMGLLHASLLSVNPNVELAALCDKSWIMRKLAKKTLKASLVTDKLSEFSKLDLDVVYVTTPIPSHYYIVKEIFRENIASNLFVEKTLTLNYAQSQELCSLAQSVKGQNLVGYMKRLSVTFRKAKELLEQAVLGDMVSFDAYAYSSDFFGVQKEGASGARGGVLEDLGSHVVDLSLWFFEDYLSSFKVQSCIAQNKDSVQFEVAGANGFGGKFDMSWIKEGYRMPEFGVAIKGTKGSLRVDDSKLELALDGAKPQRWFRQNLADYVFFLLGESEFYREDDLFIKSILSNGKCEPNFQTAAKVDYLLEQVRCKANA